MDPVSLVATAAGLITICIQAVRILKQTIETIGNAKSSLLRLLSQTERVRIFLEQLSALTTQLGSRAGILLNFNDSGPKQTINELYAFVQSISEKPAWITVRVLLNRSTADGFSKRLHRHEEEIMQTLLSVAASAAIRTEDEIRRIREEAILHSKVTAPFSSEPPAAVEAPDLQSDIIKSTATGTDSSGVDSLGKGKGTSLPIHLKPSTESSSSTRLLDAQTLVEGREYDETPQIKSHIPVLQDTKESLDPASDDDSDSLTSDADLFSKDDEIEIEQLNKLSVWFGDLSRAGFDRTYLALRDNLSDTAYCGNFDLLFQVLADVEQAYGQSWVNAPRLSKIFQKTSGWTPLHQAVYMQASKRDIASLVHRFGALRLLRTAWTNPSELPHRNMTALEIAMAIRRGDLTDILSPTILHSVPHSTLLTLQTHFHNLIQSSLYGRPNELDALRLPDLVVLTELELPVMWFPLKSEAPTGRARMGFGVSAPETLNEDTKERVRGYLYRLDGTELLVKTFNIQQKIVKLYRISEFGYRQIENAIAFHV